MIANRMIALARSILAGIACAWLVCAPAIAQTFPGLASPNQIIAGPVSGTQSAIPAERAMVDADLSPGVGRVAAQALAPTTCSLVPSTNSAVPMPVIIDGGTPINLSTNSKCPEFPFNAALAAPTANNFSFFQNQPAGFAGYASIWVNRCNVGGMMGALCDATNSGNFPIFTYMATNYRFFFTTVARADACTIAQTQAYFGNTSAAQTTLSNAGVAQLNVNNPQITGGQITNDTCWLPYVAMPAYVTNVIYDWEPGDYRATSQALATWTTLVGLVHGASQKIVWYGNNVGAFSSSAPGWQTTTACLSSGICATGAPPTTVAPNILALADYATIIADTGGGSLNNAPYNIAQYLQGQASAYGLTPGTPYSKIMLEAQIGGFDIGMEAAVAAFIRNNQVGAVDLFNNLANWGSYTDQSYQQVRCLTYDNPDQCGQFPFLLAANDGTTGTTVNLLAKLTSAGNAIITATTDTDGAIGIVAANAGTTDSAQIINYGPASAVFDNTAVAGHFVTISSTTAGQVHDAGATRPAFVQVVGRVIGSGTGLVEIMVAIQAPVPASNVIATLTSGSGISFNHASPTYGAGLQIGAASDTMQIASLELGTPGTTLGLLSFENLTSGQITVQAPTGALGTQTQTLQDVTDTFVYRASTDALTNKTFDTAGAGNVFKINGTQITAVTGTGAAVLATSPTIATPTFTTSATDPILYGGSAAGSTLTLASTSGAGTSDKTIFQTGSQVQAGFINTSQQWFIGAATNALPSGPLAIISANTGAVPSAVVSGAIESIVAADGNANKITVVSAGAAVQSSVYYYSSRGTVATPTATQNGDTLGCNFWYGYGSSYVPVAGFCVPATATFSGANGGARLDIYTTPNGTAGAVVALTIDGHGHILVRGNGPATVSTCGTGSITSGSTDVAGQVTATGATACTVNFGVAYANAPYCTVSDITTAAGLKVVPGTSSFTVSGLTSGDAFDYVCFVQANG